MTKKIRGAASDGTQKPRTVSGVWMECISCHQHLPCHPELEMCGTCTFGEADALMEFDGTWQELDMPDDR